MNFTCNICGSPNTAVEIHREGALCASCGSSMRHRSVVAVLCRELFGVVLPLTRIPVLQCVRGLGLSDTELYSRVLERLFSYRNTYLDREPVLDISEPGAGEPGRLDFLLASEVFEHVRPPVERAFANALAMLRPGGVLVMTVPYELQGDTREHYPDLGDFGTVWLRDGAVVVNRTAQGELQLFPDPVFHGGTGSTLELRCFSEAGLRKALAAGFGWVCFHPEDYPEFGIVHRESWSLPVAARQCAPQGNGDLVRDLLVKTADEWAPVLQHYQEEDSRLRAELAVRTEWLRAVETRLTGELEDRTQWARNLEAQVAERTAWAQRTDEHLKKVEDHLRRMQSSIWYRIGRRLGLAPGGV